MRATPTAFSAVRFRSKAAVLQLARTLRDLRGGVKRFARGDANYELRDVAREFALRVILTGGDLEGAGFWDGVPVERRGSFADALSGAACVMLPAYVENQPRRLLLAAAMGVPVIASDACGLGDRANVTTVRAGDVAALRTAMASAQSPKENGRLS